jgi:hypothetical protein
VPFVFVLDPAVPPLIVPALPPTVEPLELPLT